MKINWIKRKTMEEISELFGQDKYPSANRIHQEQASSNQASVYINTKFKHVIGNEEYGFAIFDITTHKVFDESNQFVDLIYHITLWTGTELVQVELCHKEYLNEKWLKQLTLTIPTASFITRKDYLKLIKSILPSESEKFYFRSIGIHRLNEKYYYAASNCSITAEGINRNIRAMQEGFDLNLGMDDKNLEPIKIKTIKKFIQYNQLHYDIFFPIHCVPLLAILRYFLKLTAFTSGTVLWIDGALGSGKTQLSVTMGDFFNRGNSQQLMSHLNTPKAKYKDICSKLTEYRNAVFIFDDVKKEETYRNRSNSKNITDMVIRSIYMGKMDSAESNEDSVDAAAIITGEFFKEQMSTISRMLYLQIDNFLNNKSDSNAFKTIQEDPYYLARFMVFFLQWLLKKMEKQEEQDGLRTRLENLKEDEELKKKFSGKKAGSRIIETVATFLLVSHVLDSFFDDSGIKKDIKSDFLADSRNVLIDLGYTTYLRTFNYGIIFEDSLKTILRDLKIKDCRYGYDYSTKTKQIANGIFETDFCSGINYQNNTKIQTPCKKEVCQETEFDEFGKLYLFGLQEEYDAILYKRSPQETLLVKEDVVCNLIKGETISQMKRLRIKLYESECSNSNIITELLENHAIYGYKRKDGFGRLISFPVFRINEDINNERYIDKIENCRMLKINTEPIDCSMLNTESLIQLDSFEKGIKKYKDDKKQSGSRHYRTLEKELSNALNEVDRFCDLK